VAAIASTRPADWLQLAIPRVNFAKGNQGEAGDSNCRDEFYAVTVHLAAGVYAVSPCCATLQDGESSFAAW